MAFMSSFAWRNYSSVSMQEVGWSYRNFNFIILCTSCFVTLDKLLKPLALIFSDEKVVVNFLR